MVTKLRRIEIVQYRAEKRDDGYVYDVESGSLSQGEVLRELNQILRENGLEPDEYGYTLWDSHSVSGIEKQPFPMRWHWIASYVVTGGSEGHYMHIDILIQKDATGELVRWPFAMAKSFAGWEGACKIANAAGQIMGA